MVAYTGQQAPGMDEGVVFSSLGTRVITNSGIVLLKATVKGAGIDDSNNNGFWVGYPGDLQLVIREGQQVPGMAEGIRFASFLNDSTLRLNSSGEFIITKTITGPDITEANNRVLLYGQGDQIVVLLRQGDPAPGMAEGIFIGYLNNPLEITDKGKFVFRIDLTGDSISDGNDFSLWMGDKDAQSLFIQEGDPAPGFDPGTVFSMGGIDLLNNGVVTLTGDYTGTESGSAVWRGEQGDLSILFNVGDPVPGMDGYTFESFIKPKSNISGHFSFGSRIKSEETGEYISATFFHDGQTTSMVFIDGMDAPGLTNGEVIRLGGVPQHNSFNSQGYVVLSMTGSSGNVLEGPEVTEDNEIAAFAGYSDDIKLVFREGDITPDSNSCPVIEETGFARVSLNNMNQAIFSAQMRDNPATGLTSGLFRWQDGEVYNFLREGDVIEIEPGVNQTLGIIDLVQRGKDFNDKGDMFVKANYDGMQMAFVMSTQCTRFFELDYRERFQSSCRNLIDQVRTNFKVCSRSSLR